MKISMIRLFPMQSLALAAMAMVVPSVQAADAVTFVRGGQAVVTSVDVEADVQMRLPPEVRAQALASKQTAGQIAENLFVRRTLGEQAVAAGLDKDPVVAAALQVMRDKVLSDELLNRAAGKAEISDDVALKQARTVYQAKPERFKVGEQLRVRHILIAGVTPESKTKAEELLTQLKAGADFAKLAEEHSSDKGSASRGGDVGLFTKGRMVPEFEAAAFSLQKKGDLSGLVQTQFGYHLIQLEERHAPMTRPFDEVKNELLREVKVEASNEARMALVRKAQEKAVPDVKAIEAFAVRNESKVQALPPAGDSATRR
ncbi:MULTISPECIES: peptidylprolyl isomerase [Delftia]|jgi:peptidyl-prolyl cis-trans isomerase C|uniref:peptidylprolyl isomerase n=1 Tax=Delftia TaxID=80865 RepID=UPI0006408ED9|nr:peptidylprolyl isomerase [Delftia lacustris]